LKFASKPADFTETASVTTNPLGQLVVTWTAPDSNFDIITQYQIQFYASGEWYEDTFFCDGS